MNIGSDHEQERIGTAIIFLHSARPDLTAAQCSDVVMNNLATGNFLLPSTPEAVKPPEAEPGGQLPMWPGVPGWPGTTYNGRNGEGR